MYYFMTWRAIQGIFHSKSTVSARPKGTEYSPYCPTQGIAIIDLLYDFHVTIGTGNNERLYRHGQ